MGAPRWRGTVESRHSHQASRQAREGRASRTATGLRRAQRPVRPPVSLSTPKSFLAILDFFQSFQNTVCSLWTPYLPHPCSLPVNVFPSPVPSYLGSSFESPAYPEPRPCSEGTQVSPWESTPAVPVLQRSAWLPTSPWPGACTSDSFTDLLGGSCDE